MSINAFAFYDCLTIGLKLQRNFGEVADSEIHLFTYLSCLLSLYDSNPVEEWGYHFAATENGYPYSHDIQNTIEFLYKSGLIIRAFEFLKFKDEANKEYNELASLSINSKRNLYLDGACSSLITLPIGIIRKAVSSEKDIHGANALHQARQLFGEVGLQFLYDQFQLLTEAIGSKPKEMMLPAVIWLKYQVRLSEVNR